MKAATVALDCPAGGFRVLRKGFGKSQEGLSELESGRSGGSGTDDPVSRSRAVPRLPATKRKAPAMPRKVPATPPSLLQRCRAFQQRAGTFPQRCGRLRQRSRVHGPWCRRRGQRCRSFLLRSRGCGQRYRNQRQRYGNWGQRYGNLGQRSRVYGQRYGTLRHAAGLSGHAAEDAGALPEDPAACPASSVAWQTCSVRRRSVAEARQEDVLRCAEGAAPGRQHNDSRLECPAPAAEEGADCAESCRRHPAGFSPYPGGSASCPKSCAPSAGCVWRDAGIAEGGAAGGASGSVRCRRCAACRLQRKRMQHNLSLDQPWATSMSVLGEVVADKEKGVVGT